LFTKYRVHKFSNARAEGRTDGRSGRKHYGLRPVQTGGGIRIKAKISLMTPLNAVLIHTNEPVTIDKVKIHR